MQQPAFTPPSPLPPSSLLPLPSVSPKRVRTSPNLATCCTTAPARHISTRDGTPLLTHVTPSLSTHTRTAVLLHDFMTDHRLFTRLTPLLCTRSPSSFAISYDARGFGRSADPPPSLYSRLDDVDDVASSLTQPAPPLDLVGVGLGGAVALQYALHRPSRVRSLTCVASGLPGHKWQPDALLNLSEARAAAQTLLAARGRGYVDEGGAAGRDLVRWKREFIAMNETWGAVLRGGEREVARLLLEMAREYRGFHFFREELVEQGFFADEEPLSSRLGEVEVPVLVLVGENDTEDFREIGREIWDGVPRKVGDGPGVVSGAGHFAVLEQPGQVAETIVEFWDSLDDEELLNGSAP